MSDVINVKIACFNDLLMVFGSASALAEALNLKASTIRSWSAKHIGIPRCHRVTIYNLALARNVRLPDDFIANGIEHEPLAKAG